MLLRKVKEKNAESMAVYPEHCRLPLNLKGLAQTMDHEEYS